ncbi:DUF3883 domain-containing protein [Ligilactobacillus murinus]|nr:DUF3883 domain-containing protein [Ligilactobacillus murinus]
MAHSEGEIRRAIKELLSVYGELNTTEVKEKLGKILRYDVEDLLPSDTRKNETRVVQRIGNVVSHTPQNSIKYYHEGFLVDKTQGSPAVFRLTNAVTKVGIDNKVIKKLKARTNKFVGKKVNWEKVRDRNNEIGDQGEEFARSYEIERLMNDYNLAPEIAEKTVAHLSRIQGDGLGYDISSIDDAGLPRYIEVKTTNKDAGHPFYMSENERNFFEIYKEQAFIYRVYNFDREARRGEVLIISQEELFRDYKFNTITWQVSPK